MTQREGCAVPSLCSDNASRHDCIRNLNRALTILRFYRVPMMLDGSDFYFFEHFGDFILVQMWQLRQRLMYRHHLTYDRTGKPSITSTPTGSDDDNIGNIEQLLRDNQADQLAQALALSNDEDDDLSVAVSDNHEVDRLQSRHRENDQQILSCSSAEEEAWQRFNSACTLLSQKMQSMTKCVSQFGK